MLQQGLISQSSPANRLSGAQGAIAGTIDRQPYTAQWGSSLVVLLDRLDNLGSRLHGLHNRFYGPMPIATDPQKPDAPIDGAASGIQQIIDRLHSRVSEIESIANNLNDIA